MATVLEVFGHFSAMYGLWGCHSDLIRLLILVLYKSFACLLNFLTYFHPYLSTSLRIGPFT